MTICGAIVSANSAVTTSVVQGAANTSAKDLMPLRVVGRGANESPALVDDIGGVLRQRGSKDFLAVGCALSWFPGEASPGSEPGRASREPLQHDPQQTQPQMGRLQLDGAASTCPRFRNNPGKPLCLAGEHGQRFD